MTEQRPEGGSRPPVLERGPELVVAAVLMVLAMLVIGDSLRIGAGWGDDGPRSGYFPFYVGVLLLMSSASIVVKQLLAWRQSKAVFAEREQLAGVWAIGIPMVVYVAGIWGLGLYVSSFALIAFFMKRHGKFGWPLTAAVSVGVPALLFVVFERWFLVPLPKGPLERLFGY